MLIYHQSQDPPVMPLNSHQGLQSKVSLGMKIYRQIQELFLKHLRRIRMLRNKVCSISYVLIDSFQPSVLFHDSSAAFDLQTASRREKVGVSNIELVCIFCVLRTFDQHENVY